MSPLGTEASQLNRYDRQNSPIPDPDARVTAQEDAFIQARATPGSSQQQLTRQMAGLSVSDPAGPSTIDHFPYRPAFGNAGEAVLLWANYFEIVVKPKDLMKYALEVTYQSSEGEEEGPAKSKPSKSGKGPTPAKEAKGRKLQTIIDEAISRLHPKPTLATEYKHQVISLGNLPLPSGGAVQVEYTEPGRTRVEKWDVKFHGPTSMHVDRLMAYVGNLLDPAGDVNFPKFPEEVDTIGVILGHLARADPKAVAIGRGRFFATDSQRAEHANLPRDSLISILRGYFQSVRPATGRLLLNTNVTHGVFRRSESLNVLLEDLRLAEMHNLDNLPEGRRRQLSHNLRLFDKSIKRARISIQLPSQQKMDKAVAGLASTKDGFGEQNKPQFKPGIGLFSGPTTTKFYLRKPSNQQTQAKGMPFDKYLTVSDYYKMSESIPVSTKRQVNVFYSLLFPSSFLLSLSLSLSPA